VSQAADLRSYLVVTVGYWGFTLTDGAIRMLVLFYFHRLGYTPFEIASLFVLYELCGVITNLLGGWLAARLGLNVTLHAGMALQVAALLLLAVPDPWLGVLYVMAVQALSGVAKDLNKMSAKASVRVLVGDQSSRLFRWVARLTGSKNALKGAGFFLGVALLEALGFRGALVTLAAALAVLLLATLAMLPRRLGRLPAKTPFRQVFSQLPAVNWLAGARLCLFASRDVWFVVGLPVFLVEVLGWEVTQAGAFLAGWIIVYGAVQAAADRLIGAEHGGASARLWAWVLLLLPAGLALALQLGWPPGPVLMAGLALFALVFALNSTVHSYLILAYSGLDRVSMNVGFYYMANAAGRLLGTVVSGLAYQQGGLVGCLWLSAGLVALAALLSTPLPAVRPDPQPGTA